MGLDDVGRRYKKFRRNLHDTWVGIKIIFYMILIALGIIFVLYVVATS
jgi:hypothetical protein